MSKLFTASASVLVFALATTGVQADQAGPGMGPDGHGHHDLGNPAADFGQPNMMGSGMMGSGMMMHPDMMLVMTDTDGNGSVSADEFQALHARMFKYLDANGDGELDADEFGSTHAERVGAANE